MTKTKKIFLATLVTVVSAGNLLRYDSTEEYPGSPEPGFSSDYLEYLALKEDCLPLIVNLPPLYEVHEKCNVFIRGGNFNLLPVLPGSDDEPENARDF